MTKQCLNSLQMFLKPLPQVYLDTTISIFSGLSVRTAYFTLYVKHLLYILRACDLEVT